MFNRSWIYLAIFLILLALVFQVKAWFVVAAFLVTILPFAWWWNRHSLDGVSYQRILAAGPFRAGAEGGPRAFPGEVVDLTLRVTNQKLLPLGWMQVEDQWSTALPLQEGDLFPSPSGQMGHLRIAFSLRWYERVNRHYQVRCTRRGFYPFGPVRLIAGDIFGLFAHSQSQTHLDWLIVYPQVLPLETLGFPPKDPFGESKATWRIFEDPSRTIGVRDHQPQDSLRHVHWKATARRQDLQVKVYEPTTSRNLVIMLNVATFARHWQGVNPPLLERTIGVAASIASYAVEQRYVTGLIANGSIPHSDQPIKVLPSRRPDQLVRMLEALAAVTSFSTSSIESLLLSESPRLPWGSTLVVVTAVITEDLLAALLQLHAVGRRLVLVSLEDEPSRPYSLPADVLIHHLPAGQLPFDDSLLGEPDAWAPEVAPPIHFARRQGS
jgi:uncharacterized protein (DUF58 family)